MVKQIKLKHLPSTLRENKRYLALLIPDMLRNLQISGTPENRRFPSENKAEEIINSAILDFLGTLGYAKAGPQIVKTEQKGSRTYCILSINREHVNNVRAALALSKHQIICKGVSGTLLKLKRFIK